LNRTEYQYTVQDLLGIETPLRDLLPEDSSVDGFDNVTDGLGISAVLMEQKENRDSVDKKKGGVIEVEGSLVKFTPGWPPVRVGEVHPIEDGRYRCRIAA
jgi:hypothetical protein